MDCMYKGVGGWEEGGAGGVGRWAAVGRLQLPAGAFGDSMSPRSASHKPRQAWKV